MKTIRLLNPDSRLLYRVISLLVVLSLFLAFLPAEPVAAGKCKFKHKVKAGETLISIAELYQYDWKLIAEANDLKEPYVLTVGQVLCIPGGTKPSGTTSSTTVAAGDKKTATLTAGPSYRHVYIKAENFPKYIVYYVQVRVENDPVPYKVGRLRINKQGFYEGWFHIPLYVDQTPKMVACLKNAWTDKLSCVQYDNPYYDDPLPWPDGEQTLRPYWRINSR